MRAGRWRCAACAGLTRMRGLPRLILFGIGVGIPSLSSAGSPDAHGADDLISGVLLLAAWFWPGAEFSLTLSEAGQNILYELKRKAGWPVLDTGVHLSFRPAR